MSVEQRVRRGCEFLDEKASEGVIPVDWRERVHPESLEISELERCVLGQLVGAESVGRIFGDVVAAWSLGFDGGDEEDYEELNEVWKGVLIG